MLVCRFFNFYVRLPIGEICFRLPIRQHAVFFVTYYYAGIPGTCYMLLQTPCLLQDLGDGD